MMRCKHGFEHGIYYKLQPLSQNQDKVFCPKCGEEVSRPGFFKNPDHLLWKVDQILRHLHDDGYLHISNNEEGDIIARQVARKCLKHDTIRQDDILRFIFTNPNLERFMDFDENKEDE